MVSGARQSGQRQWSPASNRAAGMADAARSCEQHTFCRPGDLPGAIPRRTAIEPISAKDSFAPCDSTAGVAGAGAGAGCCAEGVCGAGSGSDCAMAEILTEREERPACRGGWRSRFKVWGASGGPQPRCAASGAAAVPLTGVPDRRAVPARRGGCREAPTRLEQLEASILCVLGLVRPGDLCSRVK